MPGGFQVGPFQTNYQQVVGGAVGAVNDGAKWPIPGKGKRRLDPPKPGERRPEDYERERKMLEQYLETLEKPAKPKRMPARVAKKKQAEPSRLLPRLTEAMARVAQVGELQRIEQAARAAAEDQRRAQDEQRRRRQAATAAVLLMSH